MPNLFSINAHILKSQTAPRRRNPNKSGSATPTVEKRRLTGPEFLSASRGSSFLYRVVNSVERWSEPRCWCWITLAEAEWCYITRSLLKGWGLSIITAAAFMSSLCLCLSLLPLLALFLPYQRRLCSSGGGGGSGPGQTGCRFIMRAHTHVRAHRHALAHAHHTLAMILADFFFNIFVFAYWTFTSRINLNIIYTLTHEGKSHRNAIFASFLRELRLKITCLFFHIKILIYYLVFY